MNRAGIVQPDDLIVHDSALEALDYKDISNNIVVLSRVQVSILKQLRDFIQHETGINNRATSTVADWKTFTFDEFRAFRIQRPALTTNHDFSSSFYDTTWSSLSSDKQKTWDLSSDSSKISALTADTHKITVPF